MFLGKDSLDSLEIEVILRSPKSLDCMGFCHASRDKLPKTTLPLPLHGQWDTYHGPILSFVLFLESTPPE